MVSTINTNACLPTREQELVLRAALFQGKDAIAAWEKFKSSVDVDLLDQGSQRLLPLLYHNLRAHGIEDPLMERFKGMYRLVWYKNQILFHKMAPLLQSLEDSGAETMVLKGGALALGYYDNPALRPMNDFDVLVRRDRARAAIDLLVTLGFRSKPGGPVAFTDGYLSVVSACGLINQDGHEIDLHWHALPESCYPGADDDFWEAAKPLEVQGVGTRTMSPADLFFHICVHGARREGNIPTIRWVADAVMIIEKKGVEIDWERLVMLAERRHQVLVVKNALSYLRDALNVPVPLSTLERIDKIPTSKIEHIERKGRSLSPETLGPLSSLWLHYVRYLRNMDGASLPFRPTGFPSFIQHTWGVSHLWKMPAYVFFRGIRSLRGMMALYRS